MTSETTSIYYNNLPLYTLDNHSHRNAALVFVHGRLLSVRSWEHQVGSDALASFRQVAFDLPGHGLSGRSHHPIADYSLQGLIQATRCVIETLELDNFVLVGCSLGGHVALEAMPHLPGCRGVFALTMPIKKPIRLEQMYEPGELMSQVLTENPAPDAVAAFLPLLLRPGASVPTFLFDDFYRTDARIHSAIIQSIVADNYADETDLVRNSSVPVALVAGQQEQLHKLSYLDNLSLPLWHNRPILVPDAGHLTAWENPAVVNELLRSFAEDCFAK